MWPFPLRRAVTAIRTMARIASEGETGGVSGVIILTVFGGDQSQKMVSVVSL